MKMNMISKIKDIGVRWKKMGRKRYGILFLIFTVAFFVVERVFNGGGVLPGLVSSVVIGAFFVLMWAVMDLMDDHMDHDIKDAVEEDKKKMYNK